MDAAMDFVPQNWLIKKSEPREDGSVILKVVFQDVEGSLEGAFATDPEKLDETLQGVQIMINRIEQAARDKNVGVRK